MMMHTEIRVQVVPTTNIINLIVLLYWYKVILLLAAGIPFSDVVKEAPEFTCAAKPNADACAVSCLISVFSVLLL